MKPRLPCLLAPGLALALASLCCAAPAPVYPAGKRFPLGLYAINPKDPLAKFGWNIGQTYAFARDKQGFIQQCADAGLLVLGLSSTLKTNMTEAEVARLVAECAPGGQVAWWDVPEEVKWYEEKKDSAPPSAAAGSEGVNNAQERFGGLKNLCQWLRKHDELRHPLFMYLAGDFGVEDVKHYVPLIDIVSASCYTNFKNRPHAFGRWILESRIEAIKEAGYRIGPNYLQGEKTVCAVLELFDLTQSGDRLSFPHHAYHDFWSAIACGAQGVLVYSYARRTNNPGLQAYWEQYCLAASRLTGEERLDQVVLFGQTHPSVTARVVSGPARTPRFVPRINALSPTPPPNAEIDYPAINVLTKVWGGHLYIVAVNSAVAEITTEIGGLPADISKAMVLFENREVEIVDGFLRDAVADHGVHIYKLPLGSVTYSPGKPGPIAFADVTMDAGLHEPLKGVNGHAASWGDINGDGYLDLFVGTFANHPPADYNYRGHGPTAEPDKVFINHGGARFSEVPESPVRVKGMSSGAAFADFDNDGRMDLVSSHLATTSAETAHGQINRLFRNDGTGAMVDVTARSNLVFNKGATPCSARNTFVLDYDGDGAIDLLMQNDDVWKWSIGKSHLMRNVGNMVFEDTTAKAGLPEKMHGLGGFVGDVNGDSWPDIFFAHSAVMYINNRDGTFHRLKQRFAAPEHALPYSMGNEIWTCGADLGDLNGDGLLDFVVGEHFQSGRERRIQVFINRGNDATGDPRFEEVSLPCGIQPANAKEPHVAIEDFDNDGRMDILVSNAESFIYTNAGVDTAGMPRFKGPLGSHASGSGLPYWPAGPTGDYDRDGRIDFFGAQWFGYVGSVLLRNVTEGAEDYITIALNLAGEKNRNGIGATVRIYKPGRAGDAGALLGIKCISVANGYSSGTAPEAHFGTPGYNKVDITVTMPCGGKTHRFTGVPTRQFFVATAATVRTAAGDRNE